MDNLDKRPLVEGIDYIIENGLWVFTAKYLSDRGYCCDSSCRNCPYRDVSTQRVVCFIPSLTETLINSGVNIVGRTKFCIHPEEKVQNIPVVGGTKNIIFSQINKLNPDLIILDKEENTKEMHEKLSTYKQVITHIRSFIDMSGELKKLNQILLNKNISEKIKLWERVIQLNSKPINLEQLPGVISKIKPIKKDQVIERIVYLIWRDPWMSVGKGTFIYSVLEKMRLDILHVPFEEKYPQLKIEDFNDEKTLLLFSSEPYDFSKEVESIKKLSNPSYLVDGESFSWFGDRALNFLLKHLV